MTLGELVEQLQALTDAPETEVFVQMLPPGGGQAGQEDQSGPLVRVLSGDYSEPFGVKLIVVLEATREDVTS